MAAPETQPPPALDVAIVSYRCEGLLRDCLESLARFPPDAGDDRTVVDNDSGDGTAEMVEREFPDVTLIRRRATSASAPPTTSRCARRGARTSWS